MTSVRNSRTQKVKGYEDHQGYVQIAVRIDRETFDELKTNAIKGSMAVSAKIREYINLGLDAEISKNEIIPDITTFEGVL